MLKRKFLKTLALVILPLSELTMAQTVRTPKEKIPPEMLHELKVLDMKFAKVLAGECSPGQCVYRGCLYQRHEVVTLKSNRRLPGLSIGNPEIADHAPQYFLSRAMCEYAYEPGLDEQVVKDLDKRLEAKLSKGILKVSLKSVPLPKHPDALSALGVTQGKSILADFLGEYIAPLVFTLLGSVLFLTMIWAWRRLGKDSLEDQLRFMQFKKEIENQKPDEDEAKPDTDSLTPRIEALRNYFEGETTKLQTVTQKWLSEGDYAKLAYASQIFAKSGLELLPASSGLLQKKLELQNFIQDSFIYDEQKSIKIVEELERSVGNVGCLYDERTEAFHQFYRHCHPRGFAKLLSSVHPGVGAALLTLAPSREQNLVIEHCEKGVMEAIASRLLSSPFISDSELSLAESAINDASTGKDPKRVEPDNKYDYGTKMDVGHPLSLLLGALDADTRRSLWQQAKSTNANKIPTWSHGIFYDDMLESLSNSQLKSLFMECDAKRVAPWFGNGLDPKVRDRILAIMPEAYSKALQSPVFQEMSNEGYQEDMGKALVKLCQRGEIGFDEVY